MVLNIKFPTIYYKHIFRICWNSELLAKTIHGIHFQQNAASNCEDIVSITTTTTLRNYLSYETHSTNLIIHTNYTNFDEQHETDAYVEILVIPIPEPLKHENITNHFKIFRFIFQK